MNNKYLSRCLSVILFFCIVYTTAEDLYADNGNSGKTQTSRSEIPTTSINSESSIQEIKSELNEMEIPVFEFNLKDGEFPTFDVINPPEGCIGKGITNNNYVEGEMTVSIGGEIIYESGPYEKSESGVRLKCRGNGSTAQDYIIKKSYKIKLSKKADLLFRDDKECRDKDWVLLGNGSMKLKCVAGTATALECRLAWEPKGRHVAVIINDSYMGLYYLTESVKAASKRVDIEDTGFIVENDAYWWKPDEVYFKTEFLPSYMGWTFTEPDPDEMDEDTYERIKDVISTFEYELYNNGNIEGLYDKESFANWLLAHDILGTSDAYGSNMFLVKKDYDEEFPFSSPLTMGPLWDFDDCFSKNLEGHAPIIKGRGFWFPQLIESEDFKEAYTKRFKEIKEKIGEKVLIKVREYINENPGLYKARIIDDVLKLSGRTLLTSPEEDFEELVEWFEKRINLLSDLNDNDDWGNASIPELSVPELSQGFYDLMGRKVSSDYKGLVIEIRSDGSSIKRILR